MLSVDARQTVSGRWDEVERHTARPFDPVAVTLFCGHVFGDLALARLGAAVGEAGDGHREDVPSLRAYPRISRHVRGRAFLSEQGCWLPRRILGRPREEYEG